MMQPYVQAAPPSLFARVGQALAARTSGALSAVSESVGGVAARAGGALAAQLPPVRLGRVTLADGALDAVVWGEPLPRVVEGISLMARISPGYSRFDLDLEGAARARDPRSVKCTVISPHAKRHLRHVTPGTTPAGAAPLRQFTCDVLPQGGGSGGGGAAEGGGVVGADGMLLAAEGRGAEEARPAVLSEAAGAAWDELLGTQPRQPSYGGVRGQHQQPGEPTQQQQQHPQQDQQQQQEAPAEGVPGAEAAGGAAEGAFSPWDYHHSSQPQQDPGLEAQEGDPSWQELARLQQLERFPRPPQRQPTLQRQPLLQSQQVQQQQRQQQQSELGGAIAGAAADALGSGASEAAPNSEPAPYVAPEPLFLGPTGTAALPHTVHFQASLPPAEAAAPPPGPGSGGRLRLRVSNVWPEDPDGAMDLRISVYGRGFHAPLIDRLIELPMDINAGVVDGELHVRASDDDTWDFPAITGKIACTGEAQAAARWGGLELLIVVLTQVTTGEPCMQPSQPARWLLPFAS